MPSVGEMPTSCSRLWNRAGDMMGRHQFFVHAALALVLGSVGAPGFAADNFRKLKDSEIRARLAGMETTDGVHWVEQYMRDGTYTAVHMGKSSKGKWYVRDRASPIAERFGSPATRSTFAEQDSKGFCRPRASAV